MKAFRNADGQIDFFKWDTDMLYWDGSTNNMYSNVTYNSDGTVAQILAPGAEVATAYYNFTTTTL
jgi:hypothetical protein